MRTNEYAVGRQIVAQAFRLPAVPELLFRYNSAPTQPIAAVRQKGDHSRELAMSCWGLVPSWAKDLAIGNRLINARADSVADKPSFRSAFKCRRCLVLADGFHEWQKVNGKKQPHVIQLKDC